MKKKVITGNSLWYKRNKTLWGVLLLENNQGRGGSSDFASCLATSYHSIIGYVLFCFIPCMVTDCI